MTEIILTDLEKLETIQLSSTMDYEDHPNTYPELTLTGLNSLTGLKELSCESNRLTKLDLSGVPQLSGLNCEKIV